MELVQKLNDATLKASVAISVAALPVVASASSVGEDWSDIFGDEADSTASINAEKIEDTAGNFYNLLKLALVILGLFIFAGGILQVIKASKSNGQIPATSGWIAIFGGATLASAGVIFFALGSGIRDSIVSTS